MKTIAEMLDDAQDDEQFKTVILSLFPALEKQMEADEQDR